MSTPQPRIYMAGIGGIGMSALARFLHQEGAWVEGYDRVRGERVRELAALGIPVSQDETAFAPEAYDEVIYTPAVGEAFAPLVRAREAGLPVRKRAAVLGEIAARYKTLAVAGTHGKTTTSCLLAHILKATGADFSALLGGLPANYGTNYIGAGNEWLVTEADEYDRSLLHLRPYLSLITATEADHLDIYHQQEALKTTYRQYAEQTDPAGQLLLNAREQTLWQELSEAPFSVATYGVAAGQHRAENVRAEGLVMQFDYRAPDCSLAGLRLPLAGRHNVENAVGAIAMARAAGTPAERIPQALASFAGIYRRFQVLLDQPALAYIDDYAHHPTELEAVITSARNLFPERQLTAVFQPHLYSRTRDFAAGFAQALEAADQVVLLHIYPARELSIPNVSSNLLYQQITNPNKHLLTLEEVVATLPGLIQKPAVVLTLGAGDIDTIAQPLKTQLAEL